MRNWLKGMFGSSVPLPKGVTPTWVEELRTMLAGVLSAGVREIDRS